MQMIDLFPDEEKMRKIDLTGLEQLAKNLNLNDDVIEKAIYIYDKCLERKLEEVKISQRAHVIRQLKSRGRKYHIAAVLYAACRSTETARTLNDVAFGTQSVLGLGDRRARNSIARNYRLILQEMDLKMPTDDPTKYVSIIVSNAGLSEKTKYSALQILNKAKDTHTSAGGSPMVLAASALYVACVWNRESKTEKVVAEDTGVAEVTIRKWYKVLVKMYKII